MLCVQAVETCQGTSDMIASFHNMWRDISVRQILERCEVCKIDFNNKSVFEEHISGREHKNKMNLCNDSSNTVLSSGTSYVNYHIQDSSVQRQELCVDGNDLKSKKRELDDQVSFVLVWDHFENSII